MLFHFGSDRLEPSLIGGVKRNQAVSMFGSLKDLISSLVEDARLKKIEDKDSRLATAALLIRVAT
ncbi:MAG: hypothetical protein WB036_26600, partial [Pseudolabrys sp.]